ncbi:MAG: serine hydrolase domain-containing protein [Kiritimatiellia bacterium]
MDLADLIESRRKAHALPGLAVAVLREGRVELLAGFGRRDAAGTAVTADTRFPLASCTKTFTAAAVATQVKAGRLRWRDRIRDVLPEFALAGGAGDGLTLWEAVTHRGPLPPHTWAWVYGDLERAAWIRQRLPHLAPYEKKEEPHRYSNILYAVLGAVVERATGRPWEEHLRDELLRPLGLTRTGFLSDRWLDEDGDTAAPFRREAGGAVAIPPFHASERHLINPASEMIGSAADAARWLGNRLEQLELLPGGLDACLVNPKRPHPSLGPLRYGCGWRMETFHDLEHAFHTGQCTGYACVFSLLPRQRIAVALLGNADGSVDAVQDIGYHLLGALTGRDPPDTWPGFQPPPPGDPRPDLAPAPAGVFPEGVFTDPGYGDLEFAKIDGRLHAHFQGRLATAGLDAAGQPCLELPAYRARFPVTRDGPALLVPFEPAVPSVRFVRG